MAQAPAFSPATAGIAIPSTAYAGLPAAADNTGVLMFCPDAPGGGSLVVSDGSTWRAFARGYQSKIVTADANGAFTWTFTPAFPAGTLPVVGYMVQQASSNQPVVVEITSLDNTQVTIKARRSQTMLTTSLSALLPFDVFGANASGAIVHLRAGPAT